MAIGNPNLEWEKTTLKDIRLEIGLFDNIIHLSGNYYIKDTKDLLSDVTLPTSIGFVSYKENIGALRNQGYEINLKAYLLRNQNWRVNIYTALTHNKNEIKSISNSLRNYNDKVDSEMNNNIPDYNKPDQQYNGSKVKVKYMEGQSTTAIYAVKSLGINPANGRELYLDSKGELTYVWDSRNQIVCGDTEPKLSGTIGINIDWKGFNLNSNFLYEFGGQEYNRTLVERVENANIAFNVDERVFNQRWQNPGDKTFFKDIKDKSVTNVSSRFVQDNNMFRLQSLSLSYTLDRELTEKWNIERLKIGFLMNDVFRISSVKQERGLTYPFARSFNLNLQIQF